MTSICSIGRKATASTLKLTQLMQRGECSLLSYMLCLRHRPYSSVSGGKMVLTYTHLDPGHHEIADLSNEDRIQWIELNTGYLIPLPNLLWRRRLTCWPIRSAIACRAC